MTFMDIKIACTCSFYTVGCLL
uniref:Uncharacterized protein n=1 Tax=Triticum urartu TaxID=4572 RepID=A0A8R7PCW9_TRIUA